MEVKLVRGGKEWHRDGKMDVCDVYEVKEDMTIHMGNYKWRRSSAKLKERDHKWNVWNARLSRKMEVRETNDHGGRISMHQNNDGCCR